MTYAVHPWKLTCPLKRDYFSREYIFQPLIFRGHVSFRGCSSMKKILGIQLFSMWFQSNWTRLISQIGSFQLFSGKKLTSFETTDFIPTFQVSSELQQMLHEEQHITETSPFLTIDFVIKTPPTNSRDISNLKRKQQNETSMNPYHPWDWYIYLPFVEMWYTRQPWKVWGMNENPLTPNINTFHFTLFQNAAAQVAIAGIGKLETRWWFP